MVDESVVSDLEDKLDEIVRGGLFVFFGLLAVKALGLVVQILIARSLGPDFYGFIVLALMIVTVSTRVFRFGIPSGLARYLPRTDSRHDEIDIIKSGLFLSLPVAVLASALIFLNAEYISVSVFNEPQISRLIRIFSLIIPLSVLFEIIIGGLRGYKQAKEKVVVETIQKIGIVLPIGVLFVLGKLDTISVTVIWAASFGWAVLAGIILLVREIGTINGLITVESTRKRELFAFSFPLMMSASMSMVMRNIDTFMIGYFLTSADVGVYNIGYQLANTILLPLSFFGFLYGPIASRLESDGQVDRMRKLLPLINKWGTMLVLPGIFLFLVYSSETIELLFGNGYTTAATSLQILTLGYVAHLINGKTGDTLEAGGYTRVILFSTFTSTIINVILNVLLIPKWGISGAAVATGSSYFVLGALLVIGLLYSMKISPISKNYIAQMGIGTVTGAIVFAVNRVLLTPESSVLFITWNILFYYITFVLLNTVAGTWASEDQFLMEFALRITKLKQIGIFLR